MDMPIRQVCVLLGQALLVVSSGVFVALVWCPFLLAGRFRTLFRRLPITNSLPVNYLVGMIVLSLPWVLGTRYVFSRTPAWDLLLANALLDVVIPLLVLYLIGLPVIAIDGLPRLGIHWVPRDAQGTTWLLLALAAAWYTLAFAGPLFAMSLILALPT